MLPIFWMASTSLKLPREIMAWPPEWIPSNPQWGNYAEAFASTVTRLLAIVLNSTSDWSLPISSAN